MVASYVTLKFSKLIWQALRRLNIEDNKDMKNFSFILKKEGFDYNHFTSTAGLNLIGEVKLCGNEYKYIRFHPIRNQKETGERKNPLVI